MSDPRIDALHDGIREAVAELRASHRPTWASPEAEAAGKKPVGCVTCWPGDGSWPCDASMVADDLAALIGDDDG